MRKSLIALLFAASLPTLALAMPEGGQQHSGEQRQHGQQLFKQLDLDPQQRMAVGKLMHEQMQTRRSITQRYLDKLPAAEKTAMDSELKAARDKNASAIRSLLKPEQQKIFDEMKDKMAKRPPHTSE